MRYAIMTHLCDSHGGHGLQAPESLRAVNVDKDRRDIRVVAAGLRLGDGLLRL